MIGAPDGDEPAHWLVVLRSEPDDLIGRSIDRLYRGLSVGQLMAGLAIDW